MNCTKFERLLDETVFNRGDESARATLKSHADDCAECQPKWSEFAVLDQVIPRWNAVYAAVAERDPIDLVDSVMFELANTDEATGDSSPRKPAAPAQPAASTPNVTAVPATAGTRVSRQTGLGLTAICATALIAAVMVSLRDRPSPDGPLVARADQSASEADNVSPTHEPAPPLDDLFADAGNAYDFVATDTASVLSDGASLFRPVGFSLRPSVDVPNTEPSTMRAMADEIPGRLERFGQGFKPISKGVSSATGFLLNVLPMDDAPQI